MLRRDARGGGDADADDVLRLTVEHRCEQRRGVGVAVRGGQHHRAVLGQVAARDAVGLRRVDQRERAVDIAAAEPDPAADDRRDRGGKAGVGQATDGVGGGPVAPLQRVGQANQRGRGVACLRRVELAGEPVASASSPAATAVSNVRRWSVTSPGSALSAAP